MTNANLSKMAQYQLYIGMDIYCQQLIATSFARGSQSRQTHSFDLSAAGLDELVRHLQATNIPANQILVVLEIAGRDWLGVAVSLQKEGYMVCLLRPVRTAHLTENRNDEARLAGAYAADLARLARQLNGQYLNWQPSVEVSTYLGQLIKRRFTYLETVRQLEQQRQNLLVSPTYSNAVVIQHVESMLATMRRQLSDVEKTWQGLLEHYQEQFACAA